MLLLPLCVVGCSRLIVEVAIIMMMLLLLCVVTTTITIVVIQHTALFQCRNRRRARELWVITRIMRRTWYVYM